MGGITPLDANKPIPKKKRYKFAPQKVRAFMHKPTKEHVPKNIYKRPKYPKHDIEERLEEDYLN